MGKLATFNSGVSRTVPEKKKTGDQKVTQNWESQDMPNRSSAKTTLISQKKEKKDPEGRGGIRQMMWEDVWTGEKSDEINFEKRL